MKKENEKFADEEMCAETDGNMAGYLCISYFSKAFQFVLTILVIFLIFQNFLVSDISDIEPIYAMR
jgi:hypothetical protein